MIEMLNYNFFVNAHSHGATANANCVKNCHKMALYPAMMGYCDSGCSKIE